MAEARVRRYHRSDRSAVLTITQESFGGVCIEANIEKKFGLIAGSSWQERKRDGIDYDLRRHARQAFVAEVDGKVVGYVSTRLYPGILVGHIANVAVSPEYQGQGIGKKLLAAALDHFRREGMRHARIETLEQNEKGCRLYPAFGFKEVARQIYYFRDL